MPILITFALTQHKMPTDNLRRLDKPALTHEERQAWMKKSMERKENIMSKGDFQIKMSELSNDCLAKSKQFKSLANKYSENKKQAEFYLECHAMFQDIAVQATKMAIEYEILIDAKSDDRNELFQIIKFLQQYQTEMNEIKEQNVKLKQAIDQGSHKSMLS